MELQVIPNRYKAIDDENGRGEEIIECLVTLGVSPQSIAALSQKLLVEIKDVRAFYNTVLANEAALREVLASNAGDVSIIMENQDRLVAIAQKTGSNDDDDGAGGGIEEQHRVAKYSTCACLVVVVVLIALVVIFNQAAIGAFVAIARYLKHNETVGLLIIFSLILVWSFPPLIGHSSLCIIVGFVWGWAGLAIAWFFSLIGAVVAYMLSSRFCAGHVRARVPEQYLPIIEAIIANEKADYLPRISTLLTLAPIPFGYNNFLLGVAAIGLRKFLLAKGVGMIPKMVRDTYVGIGIADIAAVLSGSRRADPLYLSFLAVGIVCSAAGTAIIAWQARKELARLAARNNIAPNNNDNNNDNDIT